MRHTIICVLVVMSALLTGCSAKPGPSINLHPDLNGQKVALSVSAQTATVETDANSLMPPDELAQVLKTFEDSIRDSLLLLIRSETLYDIETAPVARDAPSNDKFRYRLDFAIDDIYGFGSAFSQAANFTGFVRIRDLERNTVVFELPFQERYSREASLKGEKTFLERLVAQLPGRLSPTTDHPPSQDIRWLDPAAPTPDASAYPDADAIILANETSVDVQMRPKRVWTPLTKHGNVYTETTVHVAVKILNERGYRYSEVMIPFSEGVAIESIRARTITANGALMDVLPEQIFEVNLFPEYVFFSDMKAKKFTFPAVAPGAIVEYIYTTVAESVALWGDFAFQTTEPTLLSRFALDLPAPMTFSMALRAPESAPEEVRSKSLHLDEWAALGGYRRKASTGARKTYRFELANLPAISVEDDMPPWDEVAARLVYSSARFMGESYLDDFLDVGNWYAAFTDDRFAANSDVIAKARELTANCSTPDEKAAAIVRFIQDEFRYVAVALGVGSIVPDAPSDVMKNRYGDCKGLSALTIAMLRSVGVEAWPVLVRTRDLGKLDEKFVSIGQFNHMIVHIPGIENGWFDPTDAYGAIGSLPCTDQGVRVLIAKSGGSSLATTPQSAADDNTINTTWNVVVNADGSIRCQTETVATGQDALVMRHSLASVGEETRQDWAAQRALQVSPNARLLRNCAEHLESPHDPLTLRHEFEIPNGMQQIGDVFLLPLFFPPYENVPTDPNRAHPLVFQYPYRRTDELNIRLPPEFSPDPLPAATQIESTLGKFSIHATQDDRAVALRRTLTWDAIEAKAQEYPEYERFQRQIAEASKKQMTLRGAPSDPASAQ